jgi:hypothetical protein
MGCSDYRLTFFVDGVVLSHPRKITGCRGDTVRISATTTLPGQLEYKWSMDTPTPIIGVGPYYDFTFDGTSHTIRLDLFSLDVPCGITSTITAKGKECIICPTTCIAQTAKIPAGKITSLEDENGKIYPITDCEGVCRDGSNISSAAIIKRAIKAVSKCNLKDMRVSLYHSKTANICLSLTITNSPIRFKYVTVGRSKFLFDTSKCQ